MNMEVIKSDLTLLGNFAGQGGAIYCNNCHSLIFENPIFDYNTAYQGGSFYLNYKDDYSESIEMFLDEFTIKDSNAFNDGGFLYSTCLNCDFNLKIERTSITSSASSQTSHSYFKELTTT